MMAEAKKLTAIRRQLERENEFFEQLERAREEVIDIMEFVQAAQLMGRLNPNVFQKYKYNDASEDGENGTSKRKRFDTSDDGSGDEDSSESDNGEEGERQARIQQSEAPIEMPMLITPYQEAVRDPYKLFVNTKIEAVLEGSPREQKSGMRELISQEYFKEKNAKLSDEEWAKARENLLKMMSTVTIRIRKHNPYGYLYTPAIRHRDCDPDKCWCAGTGFRRKDLRSVKEFTNLLLSCFVKTYGLNFS